MSESGEKPINPLRDWEAFVMRQVHEQTAQHTYPLRRRLDFSPFASALAALGLSQIETLQILTQTSSIPELQAKMASGELNSETLTLFYLSRIRQYNDRLGAFLELNPQALEDARALDAERQAGKLRGPLHGIPICIKDNVAVAGLHNTAGAAALSEYIASQDAFIVQKLRAAGAVILGKNNLSEWANFMTSTSVNGFSTLGGHTRNPYGPFDVGGSSSGTASAVAANLAVAGIGSETSGSLIYPAAQNSVFTLKPTLGLVSRNRIIPITDAQDTAGPLTKNATDLAILMSVITGHDPSDPLTSRANHPKVSEFAQNPSEYSLPKLRIGFIRQSQREGDLALLEAVAQALQSLETETVEVPMPEGKIEMLPVLHYGLREGVNAYLKAANIPLDLSKVIAHNAAHPEAAPYGQDLLITSQETSMTAEEYQALVEENRRVGILELRNLMQAHNVSVLLTVSNTLSNFSSTSGFPVINFPAGYRSNGEPVGASLVGDFLEDAALIALAEQVSSRLQAHRPPKL